MVGASLQAAAEGIPFKPIRGLLGSDIHRLHPEWKVIENPWNAGEDVILVPAIVPDVAIIHAKKADQLGNILAPQGNAVLAATCSNRTIVTVEEIVDYDLMDDPRGGSVISWLYIDSIVHLPNGAYPMGARGYYGGDEAHIRAYMEAAKSEESFKAWLDKHVYDLKDWNEYVELAKAGTMVVR